MPELDNVVAGETLNAAGAFTVSEMLREVFPLLLVVLVKLTVSL